MARRKPKYKVDQSVIAHLFDFPQEPIFTPQASPRIYNKNEEGLGMDIPREIQTAAMAYCTDRETFYEGHEGTLHHQYLDMLFLNSGTRPDLAEMIPLWVLGHSPVRGTHGYDGISIKKRDVECKTQCLKDKDLAKKSLGNIRINDVSESIIAKYDNDNPEFLFSFFIEGHLLAIFEIDWKELRPYYVEALSKPGRKSVQLSRYRWEDFCTLRYHNVHKDIEAYIPKNFKKLLTS